MEFRENKTGLVRRFCCIAGLLRGFSLVSVSSLHSIQRADPMAQVDQVLVVEQDITASKTDNLPCRSRSVPAVESRIRIGGSNRSAATTGYDFLCQTMTFHDFVRRTVAVGALARIAVVTKGRWPIGSDVGYARSTALGEVRIFAGLRTVGRAEGLPQRHAPDPSLAWTGRAEENAGVEKTA